MTIDIIRAQQSIRAARRDLDEAGILESCVDKLKATVKELSAMPMFKNDDAQDMLARILDDVIPEYDAKATAQMEQASEHLGWRE